ncbi:MAG: zf-HC2 domain-containing protein [Candidatus Rokubacteria bacterium]|nr:zf-HC2 domain-containing protein [Candidatus Rokubacteria bacterium]
MSALACAEPLDLAVLIDYWLGDLAPDAEERVEEHLLGCAACSQRTGDFVALTGGVRSLANFGVVRAVVTSAFLERLIDEGLRVREYRLVPGGSAECTVTPSDDLVAARLAADLRGAEHVDLVKCDADGREENRLKDIPVSASAQEVVLLERIDRIRALPARVQRVRLVAPDADGERLLAEYTFVHTPSSHE